jgi:hypothetical protein
MDRNRILEKIQKALNLAKNGAATEGEAAAALNSAQAMMRKYGVDEKELNGVGYGKEKIQCPIQAGKKAPAHLLHMIALIKRAFGVKPIMNREVRVSDPSWTIEYFGPEHRVVMAVYTHAVLFRAMEKGWQAHLKANPHLKGDRGARSGFYIGWIEAVKKQVMELAMTPEEEERTNALVEATHGALSKVRASKTALDGGAFAAGMSNGSDFKLHRPMGGGAAERLRLGA